MCKLEAGPPRSTCSTRDIRWKALPAAPFPLSEGSKLRSGAGRVVLSLLPPYLTPVVPSFSVQYRQCIQPSRGPKGKARDTVHSGWAKRHLPESGEGVLLRWFLVSFLASGKSLEWELLLLLLVGPIASLVCTVLDSGGNAGETAGESDSSSLFLQPPSSLAITALFSEDTEANRV